MVHSLLQNAADRVVNRMTDFFPLSSVIIFLAQLFNSENCDSSFDNVWLICLSAVHTEVVHKRSAHVLQWVLQVIYSFIYLNQVTSPTGR